jgi:monovalent cation/hydrogen antiporter
VSLAAALALPLETDAGAPLPDRELIQFFAFAVILVTVVGQGLTLPALIRRLGVQQDASEEEAEEVRARLAVADAAIRRLDELAQDGAVNPDTVERVRGLFEFRMRRFGTRAGKRDDDGIEDRSLAYQRLMHELYTAQRQTLLELDRSGQISTEVMRRIQRELDLEESRLEV